jgi:transcriptional regulator
MYLPRHFEQRDRAHLLEVMREHSFATVVTAVDGEPFASHVPVRVEELADGTLRIEGHVAAMNPQVRAYDAGARALVIFAGPHTYVSPTLYKSAGRVPTWNYIAVHARGAMRALHDRAAKHDLLMRLIERYEPSFMATFVAFEPRHRDALLDGITGFDLLVDRLDGKFKLGQHRLADDLPAMQEMHEHGDHDRQAIARWMKRLGFWS